MAPSFLVWKKDGEVATATLPGGKKGADWKQAFLSLDRISRHHQEKSGNLEEIANLRRIWLHSFSRNCLKCYSGRNIKPMYGDSSTVGPLSWMRTGKNLVWRCSLRISS